MIYFVEIFHLLLMFKNTKQIFFLIFSENSILIFKNYKKTLEYDLFCGNISPFFFLC